MSAISSSNQHMDASCPTGTNTPLPCTHQANCAGATARLEAAARSTPLSSANAHARPCCGACATGMMSLQGGELLRGCVFVCRPVDRGAIKP